MVKEPERIAQIIAAARAEYCDGSDNNVEIDDKPTFAPGDGGCWVSAWVWVADEGEE